MTDREETLVYRFDRDIEQVLHNIVNDFNRNADYKKRWNINPKEEVHVSIKTSGDFLELRVQGLRGGWRQSVVDQREMTKHLAEMRKVLKSAESDLRKEFKKVTGKSFRWSKGKTWADYEKIALNGLYCFHAVKAGPIQTKLDRQKHTEDGPEINTGAVDKDDEWGLHDLVSLPQRWR